MNLTALEEKEKKLEQQIERSTSSVKRNILETLKKMIQMEIANIEQFTNYIEAHTWKVCLENNITNLEDAMTRGDDPEEIFGHVLYALKNINDGFSSIQPCSRETPCSSSLWDRR